MYKAGDTVIAIKVRPGSRITEGKRYVIKHVEVGYFGIINDKGDLENFFEWRFDKTLKEKIIKVFGIVNFTKEHYK